MVHSRHSKIHRTTRIFVVAALFLTCFAVVFLLRDKFFIVKKKVEEAGAIYRVRAEKLFGFSEENSLKEWEEKIFKGKVVYRIEKESDLSFVRATSNGTASALYYRIRLDAKKKYPIVSWDWKVDKFPTKKNPESLETKNEDDFAARVYVIFPAAFFLNSKVLEYVWAETLPVGMTGTSPYSKNIQLFVLRSGLDKEIIWVPEERNIISDYMKVFGRAPEYDVGAVAFMTNAEHTGTTADAMYDNIKLGYRETASRRKGENQ